ncbi:MAG: hypothetical protein UZ20_WS6002000888 [candidate division WS6 bacterium OLB21]|uniref:Uncharacterized protein n=1 Tax=candidate division WS6 bacterium OLB21 TaxID=1617427 RepID=A0A136KG28_9BACT|nr:MAG: hypothetical protein UZ20_WS6002000888 [candidate division WS6 bacterium OLB21]
MYEYELFRFLAKWRKAGKYPPASAWPGYLQFGSSIWATINKLHSFTATDMHEYEASFFAEGEKIITTKPIRGSEASVTASHSFQVKYIPDNGRGVYQKQVILDGSVINRETVLPNNVPQEIVAGFCSMYILTLSTSIPITKKPMDFFLLLM